MSKYTKEKLSNVVSFKTGKLNSNASVINGKYPFFTCSQEIYRTNTFSFDTECVLLGGNNANGIYPIKYFSGKFDAYQRTYIIRTLNDAILTNKWLFYALSLELEYLRKISTGAATKFLTLTILNNLEIPCPKMETQSKLVCVLSAYDNLIENNNRRIAILEEIAQKLYREWFVNFRFPGHEKVKMVESEMGLIPEGWTVKKASEVITTQYGYTESATDKSIGPRYLRGTDINKKSYINWSEVPFCPISEKDYMKYKLNKNDVLIIRMADPGKIGMVEDDVDAVFASYLIRIAPIEEILTPYYLFYMTNASYFQDFVLGASTGATRKSISAETIKEAKIMIPDKELQNNFDASVIPYRTAISNLLKKNTNLRKTRELLLPRLISGDIDVSELPIKAEED